MQSNKPLDAVFIADLHLRPESKAVAALAAKFLDTIAPTSHKLFILGDLVEYWLGDDAYDGQLDGVFNKLAALARQNTRCYLMHGNRDFLLGQRFAAKFNCELITEDSYLLPTGSTGSSASDGPTGADNLLLMHGDTLCTDDHEYQNMRQLLRSDAWQRDFLALSVEERLLKAQQLRSQSVERTAQKSDSICDVNQHSVVEEMKRLGVTRLLHGHTHRPDTHLFEVDDDTDGEPASRWVVGDWHATGAVYGVMRDGQVELQEFLPD